MAGIQCTQLHHVNVVVGDLDAARHFYCDVLGLREIARPNFTTQGFWVEVGAAQVHVALGVDAAPRRHHFALEVTSYDAAVAHLQAHGIEVRPFPTVEGAGRQAAIRDPAGNLVEIRQSV